MKCTRFISLVLALAPAGSLGATPPTAPASAAMPLAAPASAAASSNQTPPAPAPAPAASLPPEDEHPGPTRDEVVQAFQKDCHATFEVTAFEYDEPKKVPECEARDIQQNCNPDTFGCFAGLETCEIACAKPCKRCQSTCGASCDGCRATCKPGDAACVRRCAEARADCRDTCVASASKCTGETCPRAAQACSLNNEQRVRLECPHSDCDAFRNCVEGGDPSQTEPRCARKFPSMSAFCRSACVYEPWPSIDPGEGAVHLPADPGAQARCTAAAACPDTYAALYPYLARFCAGTLTGAELAGLQADVASKAIDLRSLTLLFNTHGALYGYAFKRETWLNAFFYGSAVQSAGGAPPATGAVWLPPECAPRIRSFAKVGDVPASLTTLRDRVKALWNEAR